MKTLLLVYNLETIQQRFNTLRIQFFVKIKQNPASIARKVLKYSIKQHVNNKILGDIRYRYFDTISNNLKQYH